MTNDDKDLVKAWAGPLQSGGNFGDGETQGSPQLMKRRRKMAVKKLTKRELIKAQHESHITATAITLEKTGYKFQQGRAKATKKLSKKAQAVQEFLGGEPFNCRTAQVAKLMSIVLGEEIELDINDDDNKCSDSFEAQSITDMSLVVPNTLIFNHDTNKVEVVSGGVSPGDRYTYSITGDNICDYSSRPATQQEIQKYLVETYGKIPPFVKRK